MNLSSINNDRILNAIIATQPRQQSHIFQINHHSNFLLYNQNISSSKYSSVKLQISLFHQKIHYSHYVPNKSHHHHLFYLSTISQSLQSLLSMIKPIEK